MCSEIKELLIKYQNSTCTDEEKAIVRKHLKNCDQCKKTLMELEYDVSYDKEDMKNYGDSTDNLIEKSVKSKISIKNKLFITIILIVIAMISVVAVNRWIRSKQLIYFIEEYVEFTYDSYQIPEQYQSDDFEKLWGNVYYHKDVLKGWLSEYYWEENISFDVAFYDIEDMLDMQVQGDLSAPLVTYDELDIDIEIKSMTSSDADIVVHIGDILWDMSCVRDGDRWYVETRYVTMP